MSDEKEKKKALKQSYRKKKKKDYSKSSGKVPWTKVIIVIAIIIVVIIAISLITWYNMPDPYVDVTERDVIYADFDGNEVSVEYLNTYLKLAPKVQSIEPVVTDYFPSKYTATTGVDFSSQSINQIQFLVPEILRYTELDWEYTLNTTDINLNNWIYDPFLQAYPNKILNNTETTINISSSFKAEIKLDNSLIRIGLKNNIIMGNNSLYIEPISAGYKTFDSGFYYEKMISSLDQDQKLELLFQINVTLNSSIGIDLLNLTNSRDYKFIQIVKNNHLINNYFGSGFTEAQIDFTGFEDDPLVFREKQLGINLEFSNITIYPL
jgi:flagellar basal body-associated protein FliL